MGLFALVQDAHGLSAGEAGLQLMPIADVAFAELPAEVDVAALVSAEEIDQTGLVVLQFAADFAELIDQVLQPVELVLQLRFGLLLILGSLCLRFKPGLQRRRKLMGLDDIVDDPANQRQGLVGLLEGEPTFWPGRGNGRGGKKLWAGHVRLPFLLVETPVW